MAKYDTQDRRVLLQIADQAIAFGLEYNKGLLLNLENYSNKLREVRASFVTLRKRNNLRGCIGTIKGYQELVRDVANNAFSAAFADSRFPPLDKTEYDQISIHISVLTQAKKIHFTSEEDLLGKLRPNIDGLILTEQSNTATFLPSVWEDIHSPQVFLNHLKMKAGLPQDYWSDTITFGRYTTECIS